MRQVRGEQHTDAPRKGLATYVCSKWRARPLYFGSRCDDVVGRGGMSLSSYTLLLLFIAASNAILGFGGAMLLGYGPRVPAVKLQFSWRTWLAMIGAWCRNWRRRSSTSTSAVEKPSPRFVDEGATGLTLTPIGFGDHLPSDEIGLHSPAPADDTLSLDAALAQLSRDVAAVHDELDELGDRVRSCSATPTIELVEECVADLKQTSQRLYQQQQQAIAVVQPADSDGFETAAAKADAREVVEQQAEHLRQSLAELDTWQVDATHLDEDCQRLQTAAEQLRHTCEEVEQALHDAALSRSEEKHFSDTPVSEPEPHAIRHQSIHNVAGVGRI
jgi:hypothetical protein